MTALFESLLPMLICDIFSLSIPTFLHFSQVGKPIIDKHPNYHPSTRYCIDQRLIVATTAMRKVISHNTARNLRSNRFS